VAPDDARDRRALQHCSYSFAAIKTVWDDEESRCLSLSRVDRKKRVMPVWPCCNWPPATHSAWTGESL